MEWETFHHVCCYVYIVCVWCEEQSADERLVLANVVCIMEHSVAHISHPSEAFLEQVETRVVQLMLTSHQSPVSAVHLLTIYTLCCKKTSPFLFFFYYTGKCGPILILVGITVAEEICNKSMHVYPPHLFTVLIQCLVKLMIHLPVFTVCFPVFQKTSPFIFLWLLSQMLTDFYNIS